MSGGHWDYAGGKVQMLLDDIGDDEEVQRRFPNIAKLLIGLGSALYAVEHELDWDLSMDNAIKDDDEWERRHIHELLNVVMREVPDEWFPRGKWATIQAVEGRHSDENDVESEGIS